MIDAFGGAQPGQLLVLALETRQLQGFEIMGEKDLGCLGVHAASPASGDRRRIYAFAEVFSTVARGR